MADARVVDEGQHRSVEARFKFLEQAIWRPGVAHVCPDRGGASTLAFDLAHDRFCAVLVGAVVDSNRPTVGRQPVGDSGADTAGGARHERAAFLRGARVIHRGLAFPRPIAPLPLPM